MQPFQVQLTEQEKQALRDLVAASIRQGFEPEQRDTFPAAPTAALQRHLGAFVTLHQRNGSLRGCIGHIASDAPLWDTVARMAQAAAFSDPRFPPLTPGEWEGITWEISLISPLTVCPDPALVETGRHGLAIVYKGASGLLLPQVASQQGWDQKTLLRQTCHKAGLPPDTWRNPEAQLLWFEAAII